MRPDQAKALCGSAILCFCSCTACMHAPPVAGGVSNTLTVMSTGQNVADVTFLTKSLKTYQERTGIRARSVPGYDSVDTRLMLLQDLFAKHSPEPDISEIDNIWPGMLADDLVDLKPYLGDELTAIDQRLLDVFTVRGRLVAVPESVESPVLFYRTDLLRKYGYRGPPRTWDELGRMAKVIQDGERRAGSADFWGYLWQGAEGESLNCNALEWQRAEGANLFDSAGNLCPFNPAADSALRRARSWVGTISPPTVVEYDEEDSYNTWLAGSAAFVRGWQSLYETSEVSPVVGKKFATAALPGGKAGYAWTFGGMGWAVSRYSAHRREAVQVVRYLISADLQRQRVAVSSTIPSRSIMLQDGNLLRNTSYNGWLGQHWRDGMFARPSAVTGKKYDAVSRAYSKAVHDVISGKRDSHQALMDLQTELTAIMRQPVLTH